VSDASGAADTGGSDLDSLFVAVAEAMDTGRVSDVHRPNRPAPGLFDETSDSASTQAGADEAGAAARSIRCRSGIIFDLCLRAWMSEEGVEPELVRTAAEARREGDEVAEDFSRPHVRILRTACRRVDREICRLQGFARFSPRSDGVFSAPLEPDHNVVAALAPHFSRRFGRQAFAIVDLRRRIAIASAGGTLRALAGGDALALLPDLDDGEERCLWRRYFGATENADRRNPALQRSLMPARYWKYLPEFGPTSTGRPAP
jgi:probable DNA metabolism protein